MSAYNSNPLGGSEPQARQPGNNQPQPLRDDRPLIAESKDLLQGRRELWIQHRQEMYRLRVTGSGKLYLTK